MIVSHAVESRRECLQLEALSAALGIGLADHFLEYRTMQLFA
jgi:hypothetical protein